MSYTAKGEDGKTLYTVRGFVANADVCGDLEIYSYTPLSLQDSNLRKIFSSFQLNEKYAPQFKDLYFYAQILYQHRMYGPAAPVYEKALAKLNGDPGSTQTMKRVMTDQAGMSYGMSGNIAKARAIFEKAVAVDPDYPLYYYNLACADAEEKNLAGAKKHLQEAFDRKANVIPGEGMPDRRGMILSCLIETTKNSGRSCKGLAESDKGNSILLYTVTGRTCPTMTLPEQYWRTIAMCTINGFGPIVYSGYRVPSLRSGQTTNAHSRHRHIGPIRRHHAG